MTIKLNPFYRVIESEEYPASRILRRTFFEKWADTFYIIAGKRGKGFNFDGNGIRYKICNEIFEIKNEENDPDKIAQEEHLGLLDYATFGLTKLNNELAVWCFVNHWFDEPERHVLDLMAKVFLIPSIILFILLNVVHYTVASCLTLLISPWIYYVHFIAGKLAGGNELMKESKKLQCDLPQAERRFCLALGDSQYEAKELIQFVHLTSLDFILSQHKKTLSDISIDFKKASHNKILPILVILICNIGEENNTTFEINLEQLNDLNKKAISALISLNAGGILYRIEEIKKANLYTQELADIFNSVKQDQDIVQHSDILISESADLNGQSLRDAEDVNFIVDCEASDESNDDFKNKFASECSSLMQEIEVTVVEPLEKSYKTAKTLHRWFKEPRIALTNGFTMQNKLGNSEDSVTWRQTY